MPAILIAVAVAVSVGASLLSLILDTKKWLALIALLISISAAWRFWVWIA